MKALRSCSAFVCLLLLTLAAAGSADTPSRTAAAAAARGGVSVLSAADTASSGSATAVEPAYYYPGSECVQHLGSGCEQCLMQRSFQGRRRLQDAEPGSPTAAGDTEATAAAPGSVVSDAAAQAVDNLTSASTVTSGRSTTSTSIHLRRLRQLATALPQSVYAIAQQQRGWLGSRFRPNLEKNDGNDGGDMRGGSDNDRDSGRQQERDSSRERAGGWASRPSTRPGSAASRDRSSGSSGAGDGTRSRRHRGDAESPTNIVGRRRGGDGGQSDGSGGEEGDSRRSDDSHRSDEDSSSSDDSLSNDDSQQWHDVPSDSDGSSGSSDGSQQDSSSHDDDNSSDDKNHLIGDSDGGSNSSNSSRSDGGGRSDKNGSSGGQDEEESSHQDTDDVNSGSDRFESGHDDDSDDLWSCTLCDEAHGYKLVGFEDGTSRCGCADGYGVLAAGDSGQSRAAAWKQHYVEHFSCEHCPEGWVPLLPGSNLELVWNGTWSIRLIDGGSSRTGMSMRAIRARSRNRVRGGDSNSQQALMLSPSDASALAPGEVALTTAAAQDQGDPELGSQAVQLWYSSVHDGYSYYKDDGSWFQPPVYPGECVKCPEGSFQVGRECVAGAPPPGPPSPPPPVIPPSPPPPVIPSPPPPVIPSPPPPVVPSPPPPVVPSPPPPFVPPPPPPPPVSSYCCGGVACTTPVPKPPDTLPASAVMRASFGQRRRMPRRYQLVPTRMPIPPRQSMFPPPIDSLAVCTANPRQPVAGPPFTGIASNIPSLLMFIADMTPGTACRYNKTNPGGIICTAQQIAPYMLLTAEHCVNGAALRGVAGCSNSELVDLVACYNYAPQATAGATPVWRCPAANQIWAAGVSYQNRTVAGWTGDAAALPYDQGIIFMETSRPEPYFKYQYIENVGVTSTTNSWESRSYIGSGSVAAKSCGCQVCTGMTCNLSKAGPRTGGLAPDGQQPPNLAYSPSLEACQGASGNCLSVNGEACCFGTDSYEYPAEEACTSTCKNYWSAITVLKPLTALWSDVQVPLPHPGYGGTSLVRSPAGHR